MRDVLKIDNERSNEHPKKQERETKSGLMVIPVLILRRITKRAERIGRGAEIQAAGVQPNEQSANSLNYQRAGVAKRLGCVVVRHAA